MKILLLNLLLFINFLQAELVLEEVLSPDIKNFDCHSSSIVEIAPGKLAVVFKGGYGLGKSNIDIKENVGVYLTLFDGNRWSEPKEIVKASKSVCWNPVICKGPSGDLLLFYRVGPNPRTLVSFLKKSSDGGHTWTDPQILSAGITGPSKNKPLVTTSGTIISPSSIEVGEPADQYKATACWIEISNDNAQTWKKYGPIEIPTRKFGALEPALFHDAQGNLKMLCRDRAHKIGQLGYIWMATSPDEGKTWSKLAPTPLPNPDSGIDVVDLGKGKIVLFYNHSHTHRYPLNFILSPDAGETWSEPYLIEHLSGEMPAAIVTNDDMIHVTYAWAPPGIEQRRLKHVVIDPTLLQNQQFTPSAFLSPDHPLLKMRIHDVSSQEINSEETQKAIERMLSVLRQEKMESLSANQIGINKRIIIIDSKVYINPQIIWRGQDRIKILAFDRQGIPIAEEISGQSATLFKRETDRLDGK